MSARSPFATDHLKRTLQQSSTYFVFWICERGGNVAANWATAPQSHRVAVSRGKKCDVVPAKQGAPAHLAADGLRMGMPVVIYLQDRTPTRPRASDEPPWAESNRGVDALSSLMLTALTPSTGQEAERPRLASVPKPAF